MPIRLPSPSSTKTKDAKAQAKKIVSPRASVSPRAGVSSRAAANKAKEEDKKKTTEAKTRKVPPTSKPPPTVTASSHSRTGSSHPSNSVYSKGAVSAVTGPVSIHQRDAGASSHSRAPTTHSRALPIRSLQSESLVAEGPPGMNRYEPAPGYQPPVLSNNDTLDEMINKVDLQDDKYRTIAPAESEQVPGLGGRSRQSPATIPESRTRGTVTSQLTSSTATPTKQPETSGTINPPAVRQSGREAAENHYVVNTMTSGSFEPSTIVDSAFYSESQGPGASTNYPRSEHSQSRFNSMSMSSRDSEERFLQRDETLAWSADQDDDYFLSKQKIAFSCIIVSALQLMVLLIQLILCGVASVDVNPMIGPFPDAFSEWGGKNAYLMLDDSQYWRIITPVFLHVGVLHLLTNVFCQLETCAFFEREWGSGRWLTLYIISGIGCVGTSCVFDPDVIAVCSSGALMGLFGAKLAQIIGWTMFDLHNNAYYDMARLDQLGGIMCSTALIFILAFFTYIDFSGHIGGLVSGFLGGMFIFCKPIESTIVRVLWGSTGLFGLLAGAGLIGHTLWYDIEPDPDLADACGYFRNLFPEGYDCECVWN